MDAEQNEEVRVSSDPKSLGKGTGPAGLGRPASPSGWESSLPQLRVVGAFTGPPGEMLPKMKNCRLAWHLPSGSLHPA